jgi:tetratricopeptide (TPR) repeat protein
MPIDRLQALKSILEQNPEDGFARYGLAQAYASQGDHETAVSEYRRLIENNPNYAAAYFHAGQSLEQLGRTEDARAMYQRGIEVTTRIGDTHTRSELQAVLDLLG